MFTRYGLIAESVAVIAASALLLFPNPTEAPQETVRDRVLRRWELALPVKENLPETAVVVAGGDMMFDRAIRLAGEREGEDHILSCLAPVINTADLSFANLEGPVTSNPSVSA